LKELVSLLFVAIFSFLAGIIQGYFHNKKIESDLAMKESTMYHSQFHKTVSLIGAMCMIGGSIFILSLNPWPKENDLISFLGIIAFFLLGSLYWALENFFVKITFSENGIILESPWRKNRRILLSELTGYQYSREGDYHIFTTENKGKVRLSPHLKGITNFFILLEKKQNTLNERLRAQLRFGNIGD